MPPRHQQGESQSHVEDRGRLRDVHTAPLREAPLPSPSTEPIGLDEVVEDPVRLVERREVDREADEPAIGGYRNRTSDWAPSTGPWAAVAVAIANPKIAIDMDLLASNDDVDQGAPRGRRRGELGVAVDEELKGVRLPAEGVDRREVWCVGELDVEVAFACTSRACETEGPRAPREVR